MKIRKMLSKLYMKEEKQQQQPKLTVLNNVLILKDNFYFNKILS